MGQVVPHIAMGNNVTTGMTWDFSQAVETTETNGKIDPESQIDITESLHKKGKVDRL